MSQEPTAKHNQEPLELKDWCYATPWREHVPVIQTSSDAVAEVLPLRDDEEDRLLM